MPLSSLTHKRERLKHLAGSQYGYFTAVQASTIGYAKYHHAYHVKQKNWDRISVGLFRLPKSIDSMKADFTKYCLWSRNLEDQPQGVISHDSASALHGFAVYNPKEVHLTVPARFRKERPDAVIIHKASLPLSVIESHGSFMVTRLGQTLVDMRQELEAKDEWDGIIKKVLSEGRLSREEMVNLGLVSNSKTISENNDLGFSYRHENPGVLKQNIEQIETQSSKVIVFDPVSEGVWKMMYDRAETGRLRSRAGFTLVELLVVIAILSILMGLLMPVLKYAMEKSRSLLCANNIRQTGFVLSAYSDDFKDILLPAYLGSGYGSKSMWGNMLILNNYFSVPTSPDAAKNSALHCPSSKRTSTGEGVHTDYSINPPQNYYIHLNYGMNGLACGFYGTSPNGYFSSFNDMMRRGKIKKPSQTVWVSDARAKDDIASDACSYAYISSSNGFRISPSDYGDTYDYEAAGRHNSAASILFLDSHVSSFKFGKYLPDNGLYSDYFARF